MSEIKDVRNALEKLSNAPLSKIEAALVSEGLAACDEYEQAERALESAERFSLKQPLRSIAGLKAEPVEFVASILRKAGLM